ncbi:MAG: hypothetical protein HOO06_09055 [Bdellovibrionaceae bacterium]|jgi:hypothetical protein|nr:hypothetical protein [Pseudobdellovibrionaceae bacterium]
MRGFYSKLILVLSSLVLLTGFLKINAKNLNITSDMIPVYVSGETLYFVDDSKDPIEKDQYYHYFLKAKNGHYMYAEINVKDVNHSFVPMKNYYKKTKNNIYKNKSVFIRTVPLSNGNESVIFKIVGKSNESLLFKCSFEAYTQHNLKWFNGRYNCNEDIQEVEVENDNEEILLEDEDPFT